MSRFEWPDQQGLLDDFAEYFAEIGAKLVVVSADDLTAGLDRARVAEVYDPERSVHDLAALLFDGVATRHPLLDGNKRLAWQAMVTFLHLNGVYLDAPEREAAELVLAVVGRQKAVDDLAAYLAERSYPLDEDLREP